MLLILYTIFIVSLMRQWVFCSLVSLILLCGMAPMWLWPECEHTIMPYGKELEKCND